MRPSIRHAAGQGLVVLILLPVVVIVIVVVVRRHGRELRLRGAGAHVARLVRARNDEIE